MTKALSPKLAAIGALAMLSAGCVPQDDAVVVDAAYGKTLYDASCAACHGANGEGAGPASLGLGAPPPALTGLSAENGGVFPRDYVMSVIDGYSRRGHATAAMPEFGATDLGPLVDAGEGDIVTPVPADLLALARYLESIQKPS